jgi:ribosomal protein S19E (S16A)
MDGVRPLSGGRDGLERASILADRRYRRLLAVLARSGPTTVADLRRRLAVADGGDDSPADRRSIRRDLRHRCLPSLEAVGWIERRPDGIGLDEPLFETVGFTPPPLRTPDDPAWDVVSALLARPHRRTLLSVVDEHDDAVGVGELAAELRTGADVARATRADDGRQVAIVLHHVDLPKLADIGVVTYDPAERVVGPTGRLSRCLDRLDVDAR